MNNELDFEGKTFVLVGGGGGIGRATAIALSRHNARLILLDIAENALKETCKSLSGDGHKYYICNLAQVESIEPLFKTIVANEGAVDGLIYCAGIGAVRPLHLCKYDYMLNIMNINFFSFVEVARCLTKRGAYNEGMNIVGVSAIGAYLGNATKTGYCASKAAMNSAVRCMAKELSSKGIRVNTVAPGVTNTAMAASFNNLGIESDESRSILDRQYLGACEPEDIANSIIFLMSKLSRKITGSCISVDGGKLSS